VVLVVAASSSRSFLHKDSLKWVGVKNMFKTTVNRPCSHKMARTGKH
jgi:hypothetical protein